MIANSYSSKQNKQKKRVGTALFVNEVGKSSFVYNVDEKSGSYSFLKVYRQLRLTASYGVIGALVYQATAGVPFPVDELSGKLLCGTRTARRYH